MSVSDIFLAISGSVEAVATAACAYFTRQAMNKKTDVRLTNNRVTVQVDEALDRQFASKEEFETHSRKNDQDSRDIWAEINELKKENLALTKAIGEMSSKILADLANAQRLRSS